MRVLFGQLFGKNAIISSSIRYKLFFLFLVCFLSPLLLISGLTYTFTAQAVKKEFVDVNYNMLSHIGDNISYLLSDMHGISISMLTNRDVVKLLEDDFTDNQERIKANDQVQRVLINIVNNNRNVDSVELMKKDGNRITMSKYYSAETFYVNPENEGIRNLINDEDWKQDGQLGFYIGDNNQVTLIRTIRDINNPSRSLGLVAIHLRAYILSRIYTNRVFNDNTQTFIIDSRGLIISSSQTGRIGGQLEPALLAKITARPGGRWLETKLDGEKYLLFYQKLEFSSWYAANAVPYSDVMRENRIGRIVLFATLISAVICIAIINRYLKKLLAPLTEISKSMKEIEKQNYEVSIELDSRDEIGVLAKSFNRMSRRLGELIKLVYSFEIKQRDAQIALLRSQINPHFLYNVMDIIYWKSRAENAPEAAMLVRSFSMYLRMSIRGMESLVSVREEVEHLQYYVGIQKCRYKNQIEFELSVDEVLTDCQTIHFVLQPLVENALYHGIEKSGGVGRVGIDIRREADMLVIEVSDDGAGADPDEIHRLMEQPAENNRGLAVKNINDRIRLLFGGAYGLSYRRTRDELTVARVTQPLERMKKPLN